MRPREHVGPFLSQHLGNTCISSFVAIPRSKPRLLGPVLDMNLAPTIDTQQYPVLVDGTLLLLVIFQILFYYYAK